MNQHHRYYTFVKRHLNGYVLEDYIIAVRRSGIHKTLNLLNRIGFKTTAKADEIVAIFALNAYRFAIVPLNEKGEPSDEIKQISPKSVCRHKESSSRIIDLSFTSIPEFNGTYIITQYSGDGKYGCKETFLDYTEQMQKSEQYNQPEQKRVTEYYASEDLKQKVRAMTDEEWDEFIASCKKKPDFREH